MNSDLLFELLSVIAEKINIVGFDVVEVNPLLDENGRTADLAVRIIFRILAEVVKHKGVKGPLG